MFTRQRVLMALCGLLAGSLMFYFYKQNMPPPEPIKIYKTTPMDTERTQLETERTKENTTSHEHFHDPSVHEHPAHPSETKDSRTDDIADFDAMTPGIDRRDRTVNEDKTGSFIKEGISEEEAILWIQEQLEILGKQMAEKYPEIARVTELTPEEFHELYSTDEAKDAIRELALQAKNEFFADFRESLLLPSDIRESVLDETWTLVTKNWGEQIADTILTQIRAELGM